jgi:hypothetical protein
MMKSRSLILVCLLENQNGCKLQKAHYKVDSSCRKPLVICNSIFSIFLNQIKARRDQIFIVWIEYFPYKNGFKVISYDSCHKSAVAMQSGFLQLESPLDNGCFLKFGVEVGVGESIKKLRTHQSCRSVRIKQLIRDPLS